MLINLLCSIKILKKDYLGNFAQINLQKTNSEAVRRIKCPNCGTYNQNVDYCAHCNTLINFEKRREIEFQKLKQKRTLYEQQDEAKSFQWIETYKNHRYLLVRFFAYIMYSIWAAVMAIGTFIAWLFTMIAA